MQRDADTVFFAPPAIIPQSNDIPSPDVETTHIADFCIRRATAADDSAVYAVCLGTGDAGQDATHLYRDPRILGHRWVGPYLHLQPELAFVLEHKDYGVVGYVLGALNSKAFYHRLVDEWLPNLQRLYPYPEGTLFVCATFS